MSISKAFAFRKQWVRAVQSDLPPFQWSGICHEDQQKACESNLKLRADHGRVTKMMAMTDDKDYSNLRLAPASSKPYHPLWQPANAVF